MTLNDIMFYLFAGSILTFSLLTVISRRILRSAVYLLFVLVSTAGIYFMLNYNFLAAVQLTVYAGGIIVLIIFSILLTSHVSEKAVVAPVRQQIFRPGSSRRRRPDHSDHHQIRFYTNNITGNRSQCHQCRACACLLQQGRICTSFRGHLYPVACSHGGSHRTGKKRETFGGSRQSTQY